MPPFKLQPLRAPSLQHPAATRPPRQRAHLPPIAVFGLSGHFDGIRPKRFPKRFWNPYFGKFPRNPQNTETARIALTPGRGAQSGLLARGAVESGQVQTPRNHGAPDSKARTPKRHEKAQNTESTRAIEAHRASTNTGRCVTLRAKSRCRPFGLVGVSSPTQGLGILAPRGTRAEHRTALS